MTRGFLTVTLVAAVALAAVADAATPPSVQIKEFKFVPALLTVPVGATVTWINGDEEPHTVTATDRAYTSGGRAAHGRPVPRTEARRLRHARGVAEGREDGEDRLHPRRARRGHRWRQGIPEPLRRRHLREPRLPIVRLPRRPLCRSRERAGVQAGCGRRPR